MFRKPLSKPLKYSLIVWVIVSVTFFLGGAILYFAVTGPVDYSIREFVGRILGLPYDLLMAIVAGVPFFMIVLIVANIIHSGRKKDWKRFWIAIEGGVIFALVFLIVTQLIPFYWSTRNLFESCQPFELDYGSGGPYCLWLRERRKTFGRDYEIWVERPAKIAKPEYGYIIKYPHFSVHDVEKMTAIWTLDGVELRTPEDNKIFIPKAAFTGRR